MDGDPNALDWEALKVALSEAMRVLREIEGRRLSISTFHATEFIAVWISRLSHLYLWVIMHHAIHGEEVFAFDLVWPCHPHEVGQRTIFSFLFCIERLQLRASVLRHLSRFLSRAHCMRSKAQSSLSSLVAG